jgi:hypothetical protein
VTPINEGWLQERLRGIDHRVDAIEGDAESTKSDFKEQIASIRAEVGVLRGVLTEIRDDQIEAKAERKANSRVSWWIFGLVAASIIGQVLAAWLHIPPSK